MPSNIQIHPGVFTKRCPTLSWRNRAKRAIINHLEDIAPGFIDMLNGVCLVYFNKECIDLLLDEPGKFAMILLRYNEPRVVEFIIEKLILKPVLSDIGRDHDAGLLARLFLEDPVEFKRVLEELLKHFFQ